MSSTVLLSLSLLLPHPADACVHDQTCIHQQSDNFPEFTHVLYHTVTTFANFQMSHVCLRGRQSCLQWRQRTLLQTHAPGSTGLCWKGGETIMDLPGGESSCHHMPPTLPRTLPQSISATGALPGQSSLYCRALQSNKVGTHSVCSLRLSQATLTLLQVLCLHNPACTAMPCKATQTD